MLNLFFRQRRVIISHWIVTYFSSSSFQPDDVGNWHARESYSVVVGLFFVAWLGDRANFLLSNSIHRRFDCYSFDHATRKEDEPGLYQSAKWMHDLITKEEQEHGIPSNRIVIGGLSQGGSVAIMTALTTEKPLGGLFALSTYVPLRRKTAEVSFNA